MVSDDGVIKEVFPNGTSKIIERNAPFVRTEKGKIIKLEINGRFKAVFQAFDNISKVDLQLFACGKRF